MSRARIAVGLVAAALGAAGCGRVIDEPAWPALPPRVTVVWATPSPRHEVAVARQTPSPLHETAARIYESDPDHVIDGAAPRAAGPFPLHPGHDGLRFLVYEKAAPFYRWWRVNDELVCAPGAELRVEIRTDLSLADHLGFQAVYSGDGCSTPAPDRRQPRRYISTHRRPLLCCSDGPKQAWEE